MGTGGGSAAYEGEPYEGIAVPEGTAHVKSDPPRVAALWLIRYIVASMVFIMLFST